ncbi:MAG: 3-oxoacyl-[acyl-carrier protein] reductase [uncultured Thermomicrobiales bacterium]|uniref:3-oxoacyl-[acyl-carrier protein] reductase n=1 Tax=uncultured Thermomicrobiales bacterium TaxID=1645740 RepID=A0A6J4VCP8_9BACT|nr:MAG: 3-oxoacyl-[acyl-carrier protein] reductase [uncultured Thermomicrobiales bacterium]
MQLEGKKALITGADSGIGQAIAILYAQEGADVVISYGHDRAGAEETANGVRQHGRCAEIIQAELEDPQAAQALFAQAAGALGQIDILVNNAGTGPAEQEAQKDPLDDFIRVITVDLISPFALCQAAARHMVERGKGAIINVTSVHEEIPGSGAAYDAAKAGLRNVTRSMVKELAPKGVRINNIAPGMIATPMTEERLKDPEQAKQSGESIPMGRPGLPLEVANVALFLASDAASYVTGSSYFVDGGLMQTRGGA